MKLTEKQLAWFIRHYKHTKNADICQKLGISESYLHSLARLHGLKKSRQFMAKTQANAVAAAKVAVANEDEEAKQRRRDQANRNRNPERSFRKGVWSLANKTAEELAAINERRKASWRKTRQDDEVRLNWGLEQQTNFHFARLHDQAQNHRLMQLRSNLRKCGYLIPQRSGMVAYVVATTKRSEKREKNAQKFGMIIRIKVE